MSCSTDALVFELLDQVKARAPSSFSGLGLVLYHAPLRLPVTALGDESLFQPALPVQGLESIARILADISIPDSPWHDGFHLVDVDVVALTHVSQFFAPPVQALETLRFGATPIGARQMAAMVGSRIPTVECAALLSKKGRPLVFRAGVPVSKRVAG